MTWVWVVIVIILLLVLGWWLWSRQQSAKTQETQPTRTPRAEGSAAQRASSQGQQPGSAQANQQPDAAAASSSNAAAAPLVGDGNRAEQLSPVDEAADDGGLVDAEPTGPAPADTEPADVEPAETEPADVEPTDTEPTDTEPTSAEPAGQVAPGVGQRTVDPSTQRADELHPIDVEDDEVEKIGNVQQAAPATTSADSVAPQVVPADPGTANSTWVNVQDEDDSSSSGRDDDEGGSHAPEDTASADVAYAEDRPLAPAGAAETQPAGTSSGLVDRGDRAEESPSPADEDDEMARRFGAGAASPREDGSGLAGYAIKGNADSMLFHTQDSPRYEQTHAEVWFKDEAAATAAGFAHWDRAKRHAGADATPGGPAGAAPSDVAPAGDAATKAADEAGVAEAKEKAANDPMTQQFGPGAATPGEDGAAPSSAYTVKGNADSMLFHTADSPGFAPTVAEVWFVDEAAARAAGFRHWDPTQR